MERKLILLKPDEYLSAEGFPRCVHSGFCCKQTQCGVSLMKYGNLPGYRQPMELRVLADLCPALYEQNGDFLCRHAGEFSEGLYIGAGCCSTMNSDRQEKLIQLGIIGYAEH